QALDYDDLLLYWHTMLADERLAREIGADFDHILVDEYQDTNVLQAEILERLRPDGKGLTVADDAAQANCVVTHILERRERGTALRRQAVLFRSSHHSDGLELELVRRNIPYVKYGGLKFLEAAHVKDLLSVLRWADNPKNRIAAFRALQLLPGVGPATAQSAYTRF